MPIDEALRERVRAYLSRLEDVGEKGIVGGVGFTLRGNLLCGVMGQDLLVRIDKRDHDRYVAEAGGRPMVMGGRPARSWVLVDGAIVGGADGLARWIDRAIDFVATLPAK
jgi:TfoX/Sxy family transcriptional regulator of competence genes